MENAAKKILRHLPTGKEEKISAKNAFKKYKESWKLIFDSNMTYNNRMYYGFLSIRENTMQLKHDGDGLVGIPNTYTFKFRRSNDDDFIEDDGIEIVTINGDEYVVIIPTEIQAICRIYDHDDDYVVENN